MNDKQRSRRPCTATIVENEARLKQVICANQQITVNEMHAELDVGVGALEMTLSSLGYSKVCVRWVPRMLMQNHCLAVSQELLDRPGHLERSLPLASLLPLWN